jgi:hypothetical protein
MTPWLPPIPGLHRRDPEHRYWLGELEFPVSVTGVVGCLKSDFAMQRIEATRSHWEPRGNTTHRSLELMLGSLDPGQGIEAKRHGMAELGRLAMGDWQEWVQPLMDHPRWDGLQVIASERPTCCTMRGVAGTFDCAYIDKSGRRILADLKTLSAHGSTYSTAAQIGGYMALEATWGNHYDAGQTIWARPGQTTFGPLLSRSECLLAWAGAWATFKARSRDPGFI